MRLFLLKVNNVIVRLLILVTICYFITPLTITANTENPDRVVLLNTGKMNIAVQPDNGVTMFIPDAMRHVTVSDSVKVMLNGILEIGGNFYQDASTTVFAVPAAGNSTSSTGTLRFVSDRAATRYVTTLSADENTFDRGSHYIAFPHLQIATNDQLVLAAKMGIDASSLHRLSGKTGQLVLSSAQIGNDVFNASLRFPVAGTSESLVDAGAVVVEQYVKAYRNGTQLFAFATPFKKTQLSGYFAGNWLRKPQADGLLGHTTYVLGNKTSVTNPALIDLSQYVVNPLDKLQPAQAYLVKPRPAGYAYAGLQTSNGLSVTGASASVYDKDRLVFDGQVYTLAPYQEQIFADDVLFSKTIPQGTNITSTINWLIGNSYTSPISTRLLAAAMENSGLRFSPVIYVFPAGSTSYQPFDVSGSADAIPVVDAEEIPSMSVFMLRLSKGQTVNTTTTFSIGRNMLVHGNAAHNSAFRAKAAAKSKLVLKLSPVDAESVYDLAAIGVRDSASEGADRYDIAKVYNPGSEGFQLYTLSSNNAKLSANGIPASATQVQLGIKPAADSGTYRLSVNATADFFETGLWLEDMMTGQQIDLTAQSDFEFTMQPSDIPNRFTLHFGKGVTTAIPACNDIKSYYRNGTLQLRELTRQDVDATVSVYNIQGHKVLESGVDTYPEWNMHADILPGIYIVQIRGIRTSTSKLIQ